MCSSFMVSFKGDVCLSMMICLLLASLLRAGCYLKTRGRGSFVEIIHSDMTYRIGVSNPSVLPRFFFDCTEDFFLEWL